MGKMQSAWTAWTRLVEVVALIFAMPLVPFGAMIRALSRAKLRAELLGYDIERARTHYQMRQEAQQAVDFFDLYMRKQAELQRRFYYTNEFRSLNDAHIGLRLYELAQRQLVAQAEAIAGQQLTHAESERSSPHSAEPVSGVNATSSSIATPSRSRN